MNTHEFTITIFIICAVIFAIIRQVRPQQVRMLSLVILPIVAAYETYRLLPSPTIPLNQLIECLLIILVGVLVGAIQASYTKVYLKDNILYMKGGIVSLIAWVMLIFARFLITFLFQGFSLFTSFRSLEWILWAAVTAAFGSRSIILYFKHPEIGEALAKERANKRKMKKHEW